MNIGSALLLLVTTINVAHVDARDGDIALYHGQNEREGTVFVLMKGRWGPVCDDNWTLKEARVVCRQLGFVAAVAAFRGDKFGSDDGGANYALDDVTCKGEESRLIDCIFWTDHDCHQKQQAAVRCMKTKPKTSKDGFERHSLEEKGWNPLSLKATTAQLIQWRKQSFQIHQKSLPGNGSLIWASVGRVEGLICPDHFGIPEGHVACRTMGWKFADNVTKVSQSLNGRMRTILHVGHCYGNESSLQDCQSYAHLPDVECTNQDETVAVTCTQELPDVLTRVTDVQRSAYVSSVQLGQIFCAMEEKCFPESLYHLTIQFANTEQLHRITRRLLRFSSIVENVGTVDFVPVAEPIHWQWHACHSHFHSMEEFASYEIVNLTHHVVASGHKASFCLEDNICVNGHTAKYRCSTRRADKGIQGISPGCMDTYYHDYDCQWVDVTDVKPGKYKFQIITNPNFLIAESSYWNNALECDLHLGHSRGKLHNCHLKHPFDLFHASFYS